jgi:putative nucleotidyltransferase with HDIG domain
MIKIPTIEWRKQAGWVAGLILSIVFAGLLVAISTAPRWLDLDRDLVPGERASITVRRAEVSLRPTMNGRVIVARGEVISEEQAAAAHAERERQLFGPAGIAGRFAAFLVAGLLLTTFFRHTQRGRHVRVQFAALAAIVVATMAIEAALLLTPMSALAVPAATLAMLMTALIDVPGQNGRTGRDSGVSSAIAIAITVAALVPFDAAVVVVLAAQGVGGVLAIPASQRQKRQAFLIGGVAAGIAGGAAYAATYLIYGESFPLWELEDLARSPLLGALVGGIISGPVAMLLRGPMQRLIGDIPRGKLIELTDLENPLLKKIATESPGTWQHSLAMANMAEIAANAIGANALLVRVGAYYHDLGKSLQPQYYIENLTAGAQSPHDQLPPETSADAIFSHVTEGVKLARARGLPEAVIDFMHMHHGDGVLEYFWSKCNEQGNPKKLSINAFRYPGVRPQSRETAILAIVDAVEAGSRTLKNADGKAIESLVQRIVYGKLHLGQLDESGLTVADLRILSNTLVETLKHAHHVRIEYPWQKEERALREAQAQANLPSPLATASGRFVLDSADAPRPQVRAGSPSPAPAPAKSEDGSLDDTVSLAPGTMVLGPPPATKPELAAAAISQTRDVRRPTSRPARSDGDE